MVSDPDKFVIIAFQEGGGANLGKSPLAPKPKLLGIKFQATLLFSDISIQHTVYALACTHSRKFALALISKTTKKYSLGQLCTDPVLVNYWIREGGVKQ